MKFSVIIPVYNGERYLAEALDSVLSQSYDDYEIIIIDDGSADDSEAVYKKYADKYPSKIFVYKQENSGQLAARCNGIKKCSGDYCLFLDSDDLFVKDAFVQLAEQIKQYENPDVVAFPFYYDRNGSLEKSKLINEKTTLFEGEALRNIRECFFKGTALNPVWAKAVKKDIAEESTYEFENYAFLRCAEDRYQSMLMLGAADTVLYIPEHYYRYRLLDGSVTRHYSTDNIEKFNTAGLYDFEWECLIKWNLKIRQAEFDASWVVYPLYVLDLFYNHVPKDERHNVLEYPWKKLLPEGMSYADIQSCNTVSDINKRLWKWIENGDCKSLSSYFRRKKIYKKLRKFKRWRLSWL